MGRSDAASRKRLSGHVLTWGGLAVSAFFSYLAVRNTKFDDVWDGLRTSNYWWLVPAFLALAFGLCLKAVRWRYLFSRETRPPAGPLTKALLVGYFFNAILPARAGEAARVLVLNQRAGTSRAEAGTTVVVERGYDVLSLLLLLFVAVPWLPRVTWLHAAVVLALVLVAAFAVAIALLARFAVRPRALRPAAAPAAAVHLERDAGTRRRKPRSRACGSAPSTVDGRRALLDDPRLARDRALELVRDQGLPFSAFARRG